MVIEILIVDDNPSFRGMLRGLLQEGFPLARISAAPEGATALRGIKRKKPDLIFMDIRMPGKNGLALTREIKESYPDVVIVILSNLDTAEYRTAAQAAGADSFLSKESARADKIQETVEKAIGERR
jgi:DNA-binding NarL/FixJ family response regulator